MQLSDKDRSDLTKYIEDKAADSICTYEIEYPNTPCEGNKYIALKLKPNVDQKKFFDKLGGDPP